MTDNYNEYDSMNAFAIDEDASFEDLEVMWNKEIRQYALLSESEEKECGKDLKLIQNSKIVKEDNHIDLNLVLSNLTDKNAEEILTTLQKMYLDIHESSLSNEEDFLLRYVKKYKELGRVLNEEELQELGISKEKTIEEELLRKQVQEYSQYNLSKYKMIHSNLRLILPFAGKYSQKFRIDMIDLIEEGNIGLMKAVERFDVDKGFRFSTYASWYIRQKILRYIANNYSPVKTSTHYWDELKEFQKRVKELEDATNRKYTAMELASILPMNYNKVLDYILYNPSVTYLDQKVGDDEDTTIGELVPAENVDFNSSVYMEELRSAVLEYLDHLPNSLKQVVCLLYGINEGGKVYSVSEVADMLNITVGAVDQKHKKALKLIRSLVRRNGTKDKLQYFK